MGWHSGAARPLVLLALLLAAAQPVLASDATMRVHLLGTGECARRVALLSCQLRLVVQARLQAVLIVRGAVPGANGGYLYIRPTNVVH